MPSDALSTWVISCLLLGLRTVPIFAFAPPFSLLRMPTLFLVLFGLGLSICLVGTYPEASLAANANLAVIVLSAFRELTLGLMFVLIFQIVFGALYLAGRTIDIQAGYGFALLIDPTSQAQTPLVGTLFAYAAGAAFFAFGGHINLLGLLAASLNAVPLGAWIMPDPLSRILAFMSTAFLTAFGVAGGSIFALFMVDMVIAMLSRTVPQMNVLVLGFQVKTIVLFLVLPTSFGIGSALLLRMMVMTLNALPRMF